MAITITPTLEYTCDGPACPRKSEAFAGADEFLEAVKNDELHKLEADNLPIGWTHILANPVGFTGVKTWNVCSWNCFHALLMQNHGDGLGTVLRP